MNFATSPVYLAVIISNMAQIKEAYLDSVHPGITVEEVVREVCRGIRVSPNLKMIPLPTKKGAAIIRILDSEKIYTGGGLRGLTFHNCTNMPDAS